MSMPPLLQVGIRYKIWQPAGIVEIPGKGSAREMFASGAFDRQIGKVIPLMCGEKPEPGVPDDRPVLGRARVMAADVAEDGGGVTLTYEVVEVTRQSRAGA